MNALLALPLGLRLVLLFVIGLLIAGPINRGIYQLAWFPRAIGPWSPVPAGAAPRTFWDWLPLIGWWRMRREVKWHGAGFWIRPLLIELATGAGFALLYWGEVERQWLWPTFPGAVAPSLATLHAQYFAHVTLICLMLVATFIDFDEQTIPDAITIPGVVVGLLFAALLPAAALPTVFESEMGPVSVHAMVLTSSTLDPNWSNGVGGPLSWPSSLNGSRGLLLAVVGIWGWCFAILHKTWTLRRGWGKALQYLTASVARRRTWRVPLVCGIVLSVLILAVWREPGPRWESLLSAIVGICFGGGLIWFVRVVGGHALGVEAMGFGDVTLMAMIGSFLGWQASLLVFFLAPFTALVIAATQRIFTGQRHIAFGPYLCLAALIVIVGWDKIWTGWASPMFSLGWFVPMVVACCMVLMGGMLWLWRLIREAIF